jgi:hypothetical protein
MLTCNDCLLLKPLLYQYQTFPVQAQAWGYCEECDANHIPYAWPPFTLNLELTAEGNNHNGVIPIDNGGGGLRGAQLSNSPGEGPNPC